MASMTVFTMRCCTSKDDKSARRAGWMLLAALLLWLGATTASAAGITLDKAALRVQEESYRAVADFAVVPTTVVEQALAHGVALYFTSEFVLIHPRWYWLNETVAQGEQTIKLSYNALTRQYRLSYGTLFQNFGNLSDALRVLGHQVFEPFSSRLLKPGARYLAAVRMRLDPTQLPKPLQINALVNTDWELDSGWHRWNATAETAKGGGGAP